MTFFARPDLSNTQFKQLPDSILTLSGQTQIATVSGLTLTDGIGGFRPIIATGGTNFDVLTLVGNQIVLSAPTASGGTGIYSCASPTTCTVGGLLSGTTILNCTISKILQKILVPTLNPVLTPPSETLFCISPSISTYEVGANITITGCSCFNSGCISPQYSSASSCRSGLPSSYNYVDFGVPVTVTSTLLTNKHVPSSHPVTAGNNFISSSISYSAGVQPKNSSGGTYSTPLASGTTTPQVITICGQYPYFYGKVASGSVPAGSNRPTATCALIISGTKCVCNSDSTICINFNSTPDDYLWFAIPSGSTSKTCWFVNTFNNGNIGGVVSAGGNLFPTYNTVNPVTTVCWAGQTYKLYISNYQTAINTIMELRN
jgi:hypothetical protein